MPRFVPAGQADRVVTLYFAMLGGGNGLVRAELEHESVPEGFGLLGGKLLSHLRGTGGDKLFVLFAGE